MRRFHVIYLGGAEDFLAGKLWKINFEVAYKKLHGGGKKLEVQERNHGSLGQGALLKQKGRKGFQRQGDTTGPVNQLNMQAPTGARRGQIWPCHHSTPKECTPAGR